MSAMLDNWMAAFEKRIPSPLYGKPLVYLIGADYTPRTIPGSVVEGPPHNRTMAGGADKIGYCTLAENLAAQFTRTAGLDYRFVELDDSDTRPLGEVQRAITLAHSYRLGVIAKNPFLISTAPNGALAYISHSNVLGVIVERDVGTPAEYDDLRRRARKDGLLPVWFVFDGPDDSDECAAAIRAGNFKGMGVTCSTDSYKDSRTVLLPIM